MHFRLPLGMKANTMNADQTAHKGAVLSGFINVCNIGYLSTTVDKKVMTGGKRIGYQVMLKQTRY